MRTINEIKEGIAADFMRNPSAADLFGFPAGSNFEVHFSRVSIINVLFYVFACAAWTLEQLFESYRQEVETHIEQILPHTPRWYKNKTRDFMVGKELIPETDKYDTSGITPEQIDAARVVKYATADENKDSSILTIKVAGETDGIRTRLPEAIEGKLTAYLTEIKDAGVRINLVNRDPDTFNCRVDIYYNVMLPSETVGKACETAIKSYIENLPFNGEYTNMALIDRLQAVEGVRIAEFKQATSSADGVGSVVDIDARCVPAAGYFKTGLIDLNMKPYDQV